jgi:hypothetical protein
MASISTIGIPLVLSMTGRRGAGAAGRGAAGLGATAAGGEDGRGGA